MPLSSPSRIRAAIRSRFTVLSLAALASVTLLTSGCHKAITDPKDPKFIVAEVGDWKITRADLDTMVDQLLKERNVTMAQVGDANIPKLDRKVLETMILQKLLLEKAAAIAPKDIDKQEADMLTQAKGPATDEAFAKTLKDNNLTLDEVKKKIHEQLLVQNLVKSEFMDKAKPSDQEVNDTYLKYQDAFKIPAKVRASRVLVLVPEKASAADKAAAKKKIDAARARVSKGEDFSKVASEVSDDRSTAPKGGDIGYFAKGEELPEVEAVAFGSKVGVLSPVFETPLGYQFLKVTDSRPAGVATLADVRDEIYKELQMQKAKDLQDDYLKKLLADPKVKIYLVAPVADLAQPPATPGAPAPGAAPSETPEAPAPPAAPAPAAAPAAPSTPPPAPAPAK